MGILAYFEWLYSNGPEVHLNLFWNADRVDSKLDEFMDELASVERFYFSDGSYIELPMKSSV